MRRYTKADLNVPMTFYYFYIYVRIPLLIIATIYRLIVNGVSNEYLFWAEIAEVLTFLCACVGLIQKKYWGYIVNKILIIVEFSCGVLFIIISIILFAMNEWNSASSLMGTGLALIIVNPLLFIYFEKRKYLFDGAPQLYETDEKYLNENTLKQKENPVYVKKLFFVHKCPQCGSEFKVKYIISDGQTVIPPLYVTCPKCNFNETITITSPIYDNVCPNCNEKVPLNNRFCHKCGYDFNDEIGG